MAEELPENIQRWTAKRRAALVLSILRGETSIQEAARRLSRCQSAAPILSAAIPVGRLHAGVRSSGGGLLRSSPN